MGVVLALTVGVAVSTAIGAPSDPPESGPISAADVARQSGTPTIPNPPPPPPPGTPPPPPPPTGTVPTVKPPTVLPTSVIVLPSARRCVRSLRIVLRRPSGVTLKGLAIRAGARLIIRRSTPSALTTRLLPRKRFRLKVTVQTADGQTLVRTRSYQPCRRR